jgi:hypothetical protein
MPLSRTRSLLSNINRGVAICTDRIGLIVKWNQVKLYCTSSVPDPGSGTFLPLGSRIRDGAMVGSESGISKQNLLIAFIQN